MSQLLREVQTAADWSPTHGEYKIPPLLHGLHTTWRYYVLSDRIAVCILFTLLFIAIAKSIICRKIFNTKYLPMMQFQLKHYKEFSLSRWLPHWFCRGQHRHCNWTAVGIQLQYLIIRFNNIHNCVVTRRGYSYYLE